MVEQIGGRDNGDGRIINPPRRNLEAMFFTKDHDIFIDFSCHQQQEELKLNQHS